MKDNIQMLKHSEISSDVFVIAPSQIDIIAKEFGASLAEAMNVKPLSQKISEIAKNILIKTLHNAKNMGE